MLADVPVLVISFTSTLVFGLYCVITAFPESSSKFAASVSEEIADPEASSNSKAPLVYEILLIVADSWFKYIPGSAKIRYKLHVVPAPPPGKVTVLSRTILEVVEPVETLPLDSISKALLSWTFIISPGRKKDALIPVEKDTISVSFVSVS